MTRTNMTLKTIRALWRQEKPLYREIEDYGVIKRRQIHGLRVRAGQLEVKIYYYGSMIWTEAHPSQIVLAY